MRGNIKESNIHNVWQTCNKIRVKASEVNINIWDYFIPIAPKGNNLISELDFIAILLGPLGKFIGLSNQEIYELAEYFRVEDGQICYSKFCTIIHENSTNFEKNFPRVCKLEWNDTLQTNTLSSFEERKLDIILAKIAFCVKRRKILFNPYFQDHELVSKDCGVVTFSHFTRVLYFLDIILADDEMNLLIKKFIKDNYTINYVAFVNAICEKEKLTDKDENTFEKDLGRIITAELPKVDRPEVGKIKTSCVFPKQLHFLPVDSSSKRIRCIEEIILRLQEHTYKNQMYVADYFKDFDTFNNGKITESQFRRGLSTFRTSAQGNIYLSKTEIEMLIAFYKDSNDTHKINWVAFKDDIEEVYTKKYLDKQPNCKVTVPPVEVKMLPRKGYREWDCTGVDTQITSMEMKKIFAKTFQKILQRVKERNFSLRPYFQDFDKSKRGHVSRAQLRQVFSAATISLTHEEILSLEFMYNNDLGFHYLDFITKLEQILGDSVFCEIQQFNNKINISNRAEKCEISDEKDIYLILAKIKAKVVRNGIKVNEFIRGFDLRNEKIVSRFQFDRGLDQLKCELTRTEINTLMDHFQTPNRPNYVNYWLFTNEVEGAMAQGQLEKSPRTVPVRYMPSKASYKSFLNFNQRQILKRVLKSISPYVDRNLEELFKDFDKRLNIGSVTRNELIRVLDNRKIIYALNAIELDVLCKCFAVGNIKTEPRFDYRAFLNTLYTVRETQRPV